MESESDDSTQGTVTRLTQNLKGGESQTTQQLWNMPKRIAELSEFHSFYQRTESGRFTQLIDRENLWPLLVSITTHKAVDLIRYHDRVKRVGTAQVASEIPVVDKPEKGAHDSTRTERRQES